MFSETSIKEADDVCSPLIPDDELPDLDVTL